MSRRKKPFTKEWEKLVWKPFGRFFRLLLFFLLITVSGGVNLVVIAAEILLGLLWLLSLGHITLIHGFNSYLDGHVRPTLISKVGKMIISLMGGWG